MKFKKNESHRAKRCIKPVHRPILEAAGPKKLFNEERFSFKFART